MSNLISVIKAGNKLAKEIIKNINNLKSDSSNNSLNNDPLDTNVGVNSYLGEKTLSTWTTTNKRIAESRNNNIDTNLFHADDKIRNIETLDAFYRITQNLGSQQLALSNNLYGINHQGIKGVIPDNHDSYGLVFFTRPMLNLTSYNLRNIRQFYNMLTNNPYSMQNYVRNMLDPRLSIYNDGDFTSIATQQLSINMDVKDKLEHQDVTDAKDPTITTFNRIQDKAKGILDQFNIKNDDITAYSDYLDNIRSNKSYVECPLVDNKMAFIPILTNTIKEMSGWPDYTIGTYTSKEGLMREQWSIVDSFMDIYSSFDIDCTFRNIKDEPLIIMFETWLRYMANVFEGMMSPYMDMIVENEIDYNTRIYRLVLDESKTFVKKIAACGAAFPVNVPNSRFFDFNDSAKYNDSAKDINIRFKAIGAMYNDDILVHEFNQTTAIFNPDLRQFVRNGSDLPTNYAEIPYNLIHLFNYRGYPLIDKNTLQLKWYINTDSDVYTELYNYYMK